MRDEAQGSYDSAEFFPDSDVASKAHEAISGQSDDSRFRPDSGSFDAQVTTIEARGEEGAVEGIEVVAKAVSGNIRNEGIAGWRAPCIRGVPAATVRRSSRWRTR